MEDQELIRARNVVLETIGTNDFTEKNITDPLYIQAFQQSHKREEKKLFDERIKQLEKTKEKVDSKLVNNLLDKCIYITYKAIDQYKNGQLRALLILLSNDIILCNIIADQNKSVANLISQLKNEHSFKYKTEMQDMYSKCAIYFNKGIIESEYAIQLHLHISDYLCKKILKPTYVSEYWKSLKDLAATTIKLVPWIGLIDYIDNVRKLSPTDRIRINLVSADDYIKYWEGYYENMIKWIEVSLAYQLRVEDSINHFNQTFHK